MPVFYRLPCFFIGTAGIFIFFHIDCAAMDETHLFQQSLHDLVVAMSIYPQVPALLIGPVDTKLIDSDLFKYVDGYYVINDAQFLETDEEGRYSLTDYAWAHLEECTLQFTWQSLNQAEIHRHFLFELLHRVLKLFYSFIFRMVFPFDFPAATFCSASFTSSRENTSSTDASICRSANMTDICSNPAPSSCTKIK